MTSIPPSTTSTMKLVLAIHAEVAQRLWTRSIWSARGLDRTERARSRNTGFSAEVTTARKKPPIASLTLQPTSNIPHPLVSCACPGGSWAGAVGSAGAVDPVGVGDAVGDPDGSGGIEVGGFGVTVTDRVTSCAVARAGAAGAATVSETVPARATASRTLRAGRVGIAFTRPRSL
jgi:hypothetical protein